MSAAKNPRSPKAPLQRDAGDVVLFQEPIWRIRSVGSSHSLPWDGLRQFGPIVTNRWDPHPEPEGTYPGFGVSYASPDLTTTVAEVFQKGRRIRRNASQELVGWTPTRTLQLLDLSKKWLLKNGASASLAHWQKRTCRAWAHAVRDTWPELDGLLVPSTWTGEPMVVLFEPAMDSFPALPAFSKLLNDPGADLFLLRAAGALKWPISPRR